MRSSVLPLLLLCCLAVSVPVFATPTYAFTDLGLLPSGLGTSVAYDINDAGQVVGAVRGSDGASGCRAFLWTSAAGMTDLGELPGGDDRSYAYGINASGQVVGSSSTTSGSRAFLWTSGDGMIDLSTCLPTGSGWSLTTARAINDLGYIVGYGVNPGGTTHAYLLTQIIPEPSSLALMGLGLWALALRRRKA